MATVLILDSEPTGRSTLTKSLARFGHDSLSAGDSAEALQALTNNHVDLIICDWLAPGLDGLELLRMLREEDQDVPVVMLTAFGTIEHAVTAMRAGATHYLTKPFQNEQLQLTVEQALSVARLREENRSLLRELQGRRSEHEIVGESPAIRSLLESVASAASSRATVLIQGESGTGKELLARAIHAQSDRRDGPFIRMNCAALPDGLLESTLFGHEKGAISGALKRALGAFERANGGTLLLDEIGEIRADLQPRLVKALEERAIERVGGTGPTRIDVRVIATTTRDLGSDTRAGRFSEALYGQLRTFPISIPPLRERRDDIALLAHRFAARAASETGKDVQALAPETLELLGSCDWPGNVRQLQHAVERAVILATESTLRPHLFAALRTPGAMDEPLPATAGAALAATSVSSDESTGHILALPSLDLMEVERRVIEHALAMSKGNRTRAADILGINVRTLRRKLNGGRPNAPTVPSVSEPRGRVA